MSTLMLLATKLYIPPPRPKVVLRPRLIERLNEGLYRKLTLISAPAGFGKTTLVSEWLAARTEDRDSHLVTQSSVLSTQHSRGLAVAGRRGERPHPLSDLPRRCVADDCGDDWSRGVGSAPIPAATVN